MRLSTAMALALASLVVLSPARHTAAAPTGLPDTAALGRSAASFELWPGVIVDPSGELLYLMSSEGGIEAASIGSGELLWSSEEAAKPLALYGDLLIAQAESAGPQAGFEIVLLDTRRGGVRRARIPIQLPPGAWRLVDDGMGRSLEVSAVVRDGGPRVSWEHVERYVGGPAPRPGQALESRQSAAYRLDLQGVRAVAVQPGLAPAGPVGLLAGVQAAGHARSGPSQASPVGSVLATTRVVHDRGRQRLLLERWDGASGQPLPVVELLEGPHIARFISADGRHLLVSERASPGEFEEYDWSIFSLETGERLARVSHHRSHAPFFVAGNLVVYVERPYARRLAGEWVERPLQLRAVLLGGAEVWARDLRDTVYRGPYPP